MPYFYYKPPKIFDAQPREGPTRGGTVTMVYGSEFKADKKILCVYGDLRTRGKFISYSQVKCLSPKVPLPGTVPLSVTYEGDGDKFASEQVEYLYYETPEVTSLDPECGPTYGYTQITVKGKNFVDMGFGKAKCVFNETMMNATIIDEHTIKCSTPKLTLDQAALPAQYMHFDVKVTLNGHETSEGLVQFRYYPELEFSYVTDSDIGPMAGGTES